MQATKFNRAIKDIKNNKEAFNELYTFYYPKIVKLIEYYYPDKVSAMDVAQEFFVYLYEKGNEIAYVKNPTAWVYQVAKRMAYKEYSKNKTTNNADSLNSEPSEGFEEKLLIKDEIKNALQQLDERTRKIIVLHIYLGYKLNEIAKEFSSNPSTIRNIYNRGLKKLKTILNK